MAGLNAAPVAREQFKAIAYLRWCVFVHSSRTLRGRLEIVSRIFAGLGFTILGLGGTIGLAFAGWGVVTYHALVWLPLPLWLIFLYWQLFPVMATAFAENFDASNFLRFPLSYRSYFLVRLVYGSLDPTTIIGSLWLMGMTVGIGIAAPKFFLWAALVLGAYAAFNILLSRAIFSWIERWLARRKSREILGLFFFLLIICVQFISPSVNYLTHRYSGNNRAQAKETIVTALKIQSMLPPGLAASAVSRAMDGEFAGALGAFAIVCACGGACFALLDVRLRAQYRGENLSEAAVPKAAPGVKQRVRAGWSVGGFSGPIAAMVEKEFRYLSRSGPMLFNLVMPVVILLIFRFGLANGRSGGNLIHRSSALAFPVGAAYALLILSNITYNSFGTEGAGVQFYFMSPVRFREIMLAKNIAQGAVLLFEMILVWVGVCVLFRPPALDMTLATLAGVLFAALVNFVVGNLMSLYAPKKFDLAVFGRQRASGITAFAALGVQAVIFGLAGIALFAAFHYHDIWIAALLLLVLSAGALRGYIFALSRIDRIALTRRESLIGELSKTT
jgi:ABC-2 type transport system permease protein